MNITSTRSLIDELFFAQGVHLRDMLSPVHFTDAPFYTSDDTLDYIDAATDLFSLMLDFYHFDRSEDDLIRILTTPGVFSRRYACDGIASIFYDFNFPCTADDDDLDSDAIDATITDMRL